MQSLIISVLTCISLLANSSSLFAQTPNPYRVGESSNRSFKMKYGGFIATWDGRVVFYPEYGGKENYYKWVAYAIRYENIKTNSKGEPDLQDSQVYSPVVTLDSDADYGSPENKMAVLKRMHLTLVPDPDFKINPYPSDVNGKQVQDLNSPYQTYRVIFVGQAQESKYYKPTKTIPGLFMVSIGEIIVKNIGKPDTEIVSAKILQEGQVIRETATSEPFFGFEPTISNDGRLLIYAGNPKNGGIHFIMYSFNPNPKKGTGWSKPRHITDLYWSHGPGSGKELTIDGVKFSDRYPIAKKPFKDAYGKAFQPQDGYPGAYPWLSLDNSDLFCATVSTFFAARRAGYAVMGALTDYTSRHVEGLINISRTNVTGRSDVWPTFEEGKDLEAKYNQLTDETGKPYGINSFQRIMISPIGQFPSMWNFSLNGNLSSKRYALPFSEKKQTFGIIMSHSDRYVEVSLPETLDKNYLLYYPMNEAISYNRDFMKVMASYVEVKDWNDNHNMATYDPNRTPDISGNFHTGKLMGAQFPFEYFEAEKKWKNERKLTDRIVGIEGNSIFFKSKTYIETKINDLAIQSAKQNQEFNISFFLRPYSQLTQESLIFWDKFLYLEIINSDLVLKGFKNNAWVVLDKIPVPININQWQHVSLNISKNKFELFWNGYLLKQKEMTLPVLDSQTRFIIGPTVSKTVRTGALYSMDELSISKTFRSIQEVRSSALWKLNLNDSGKNSKPIGAEEIKLGEKLFNDPILSKDKTISCATCHMPKNHFQDGLKVAIGINKQAGTRNSPMLWNIGQHSSFMWDGRAKTLEEQALMPIQNPLEMNLEIKEAVARIKEKYKEEFKKIYNQDPSPENIGAALANFQRTLKPEATDFDLNKLNQQELLGRGLFMGKARCVSCHQGSMFSDFSFHNVGIKIEGDLLKADIGVGGVSKRSTDNGKFKTPSLRLIQNTAPYFHDGRFQNLKEVIEFYNRGGDTKTNRSFEIQELGLTTSEIDALEAFLRTL